MSIVKFCSACFLVMNASWQLGVHTHVVGCLALEELLERMKNICTVEEEAMLEIDESQYSWSVTLSLGGGKLLMTSILSSNGAIPAVGQGIQVMIYQVGICQG